MDHAQPIYQLRQGWSGKGYREGGDDNVVVTSGQHHPKEWKRHKFLRVRPEDENPFNWDLYVFDLGAPIMPGTVEELRFNEILVDAEDEFRTFLGWYSIRHPALERVTEVIDFGGHNVMDVVAYREEPDETSGNVYRPVEPFEKPTEKNGVFTHTWTQIDHKSRYSLHWTPLYRTDRA